MEQHFSPESLPEFLYPEKESEKNHSIRYLNSILVEELKADFTDWFYLQEDISHFSDSAKSSDLNLILFAITPSNGKNYSTLWKKLFEIINTDAKESKNPCLIINEKVPGILINATSIEDSKKIAKKIIEQFKLKTEHEAISGISYFPCLEFSISDLVKNGLKALVHASMLDTIKLAVFDSISLNVSSDEFFQKKNIDNAISELEIALKLNDKDINVLNSLGVCHAVKKDFKNAAIYFEKAANFAKDFIMPLYNLGLVYYLNGEKEKAKKTLLKAYDMSDGYFEIPFYLGKIEYDLKHFDNALTYFFKAEEIKPENAPVLNFLGDIFIKTNNFDKAYTYYKKALKVFPQNAYALSALGFIYYKRGENIEIAKTFMKQSTEIEPTNVLFRERLNLILKDKKKTDLKTA